MTTKGDPLFIEHVERLSMSDCESTPAEVRDRLRSIPAAHELLAEWPVMKAAGDAGDMIVREAIDAELDAEREAIRSGTPARNKRELALAIEQRCHRLSLPTLRPAVNATGVVIHTNLGRAPLAPAAVQAVTDVARGYSTLEYDVATCARGAAKSTPRVYCASFARLSSKRPWSCRLSRAPLLPAADRCRLSSPQHFACRLPCRWAPIRRWPKARLGSGARYAGCDARAARPGAV